MTVRLRYYDVWAPGTHDKKEAPLKVGTHKSVNRHSGSIRCACSCIIFIRVIV